MPIYEFRCGDCGRVSSRLVYSWSAAEASACGECGGGRLERLVSRFSFRRSWGDSLNWAPSGETLRDVDEDSPASLDRFMGRVKGEMGGQVTGDFEEMRREIRQGPRSFDAADSGSGGTGE